MSDRNDKTTFADALLGSGSDSETNADQHHAERGDSAGDRVTDNNMLNAIRNGEIADVKGEETLDPVNGGGGDDIIYGDNSFGNGPEANGSGDSGSGNGSHPHARDSDGGETSDGSNAGLHDDALNDGSGDGSGNDASGGGSQDGSGGDATPPDACDLTEGVGENGDTIYGGAGADTIYGMTGHDYLSGGNGDDTISGGTGNDHILGDAGDDTLSGDDGDDCIEGGEGNDIITTGAGADHVEGGDDRDTIHGNAGDVIDGGSGGDDFDTLVVTDVDHIEYTSADHEDGVVHFNDGDTLDFEDIEDIVPCFTPGTVILTSFGERLVQDLRVGDKVVTRDDGLQEIRWIGTKSLDGRLLLENPHLRPVLIKKGALGRGLPERDMRVSPNHRMLVANEETTLLFEEREVLVAAKHLVNNKGIQQVDTVGTHYVHMMFDAHEVILADGAWTESFQPGDYSLKGIGNSQRAEIFELFPELHATHGRQNYVSARRSLKRKEARLLS